MVLSQSPSQPTDLVLSAKSESGAVALQEYHVTAPYRPKVPSGRLSFQARALRRKAPTPKRIVEFLNTNFGLFLLSTVFISSFTWSFHTWTDHLRKADEATKTRQKLGLEMMNRLRYLDELQEPFPYDERHAIETAISGFNAHANVNPSWIPHYSPVFPEYEERSMISIAWELETLLSDRKRELVSKAIPRIERARSFVPRLNYQSINAAGKNPEGKLETFSLNAQDRVDLQKQILEPLAFLRDPTFYH